MKRTVAFAVAATVTAGVWLVVFRPGPGRAAEPVAPDAARWAAGTTAPGEGGTGPEGAALRLFSVEKGGFIVARKVVRPEEEWKRELTPQQYHVLREKGTERAFTGHLHDEHARGVYRCAACGNDLFTSDTKFDSGTGWPSFFAPVARENVETEVDSSLFMRRTEVHCSRCGGHLGHIFEDGPRPTGLRYCINSVSLDFEKTDK
jgi:peptide-methionine (R)-S-oxide reductase